VSAALTQTPGRARKQKPDKLLRCDRLRVESSEAWKTALMAERISTAFQFEVRLDELITTEGSDGLSAGGAVELA
jgi:hypothetical protein